VEAASAAVAVAVVAIAEGSRGAFAEGNMAGHERKQGWVALERMCYCIAGGEPGGTEEPEADLVGSDNAGMVMMDALLDVVGRAELNPPDSEMVLGEGELLEQASNGSSCSVVEVSSFATQLT
jgi:hypothetical protein